MHQYIMSHVFWIGFRLREQKGQSMAYYNSSHMMPAYVSSVYSVSRLFYPFHMYEPDLICASGGPINSAVLSQMPI